MKEKIKELTVYLVIILVVILIRAFLVTPIRVNGTSMYPTLDNGNFMVLKKYDKDIERFDIIVIKRGKDKLIKRVVGLPKEDIEYSDNELYINNEKMSDSYGDGSTTDFVDYCAQDEYYVLGDNREDSTDSRVFGCVKKENILGTTDFVIFPFGSRFGKVD